jgi:nucleoside-diphosphate-sugar epimerase
MRILISGAAGNLGTLLARHLAPGPHTLRLLYHRRPLAADLLASPNVDPVAADLGDPTTLREVCQGIDRVIHLAGVLFAPRPGRFIHDTNVGYLKNLLDAAEAARANRFILVSFPHAEGETTPEHPARGSLDAVPEVLHFRTRLEAERLLLAHEGACTPVVLRAGLIYGPGVKLFEAARWLLRRRIMATWRKPTWAHYLHIRDFLRGAEACLEKDGLTGIYTLCDDEPLLWQGFLDHFADALHVRHPWRLPAWNFYAAALLCEAFALTFHTGTPLTRDIVKAAMTSCVADTSRTKRELLPTLEVPTWREGLGALLRPRRNASAH